MAQPVPIPSPACRPLLEQVGDPTADGLPPPAQVARAVPVTSGKGRAAVSRLPLSVPGGIDNTPVDGP